MGGSHGDGPLARLRSKRGTKGVLLVVALTWGGGGGVQTPLGGQGTVDLLGGGELQVAGLLGHNGALVLGGQAGDKLGDELANLLGVQVTHLLRDINNTGDHLLVALLFTLSKDTAGAANLNRELFTAGVGNILTGLLLNILGGTGGLVDGLAHFLALTVAFLLHRLVALLNGLVESLLLEGNLTGLLKVLVTDLFLGGHKLGDIGVVALLGVLVCALKDGILLQGLNALLLLYTAETSLGILNTS